MRKPWKNNRFTKCATMDCARFGFIGDRQELEFTRATNKVGGYGVGSDCIGVRKKIMDDPLIAGFSVRCDSPCGEVNNTAKTLCFASDRIFMFSWYCRLSQY